MSAATLESCEQAAALYRSLVLNAVTDGLGGPYDAIYANAMLLHLTVSDIRTVLHKARRWAHVLAFTVREGEGERETTARLDVPRWYTYWRKKPLRDELSAAGWHVESVRQVTTARDGWLQVLAS